MNIQKKISIIVIVSIVVTVIPASLLAFRYLQAGIISQELAQLVTITGNQASLATQRFNQA
ncbi:MAG: hypothetical protein IBX57_09955 [Gammaproteobacteria bacterium]|nr:hypothetical protein [Gammaproteobacteria bacterium]